MFASFETVRNVRVHTSVSDAEFRLDGVAGFGKSPERFDGVECVVEKIMIGGYNDERMRFCGWKWKNCEIEKFWRNNHDF